IPLSQVARGFRRSTVRARSGANVQAVHQALSRSVRLDHVIARVDLASADLMLSSWTRLPFYSAASFVGRPEFAGPMPCASPGIGIICAARTPAKGMELFLSFFDRAELARFASVLSRTLNNSD